jgi:SAM-dependent methyltransferase
MELSFPQYLLSKQSVDERALNQHVYETLKSALFAHPPRVEPLQIIEVGAGIGTMPARLLRRELLTHVDYIAVDEMPENIAYAMDWIPRWAAENGWQAHPERDTLSIRLSAEQSVANLTFAQADVFDFILSGPLKADLLIAHAFLDLLPMPGSLSQLLSLLKPGGLAWLTLNFDGVSTLEPALDPLLDATIERLYHDTMDTRLTGGDSRSGRNLFGHLQKGGAHILAAGASDWVVFPQRGCYPADEAYFLKAVLHFFESSLSGHAELDPAAFAGWLAQRHAQVERGELVYIAHQMDFLVQV